MQARTSQTPQGLLLKPSPDPRIGRHSVGSLGDAPRARRSRPVLPPQGHFQSSPAYTGGKTQGILQAGAKEIDLISGYAGPASQIPRGTPGFNNLVRSHVEAHAAAVMRMEGLSEATLYINRIPCASVNGCNAMLPRMLPEGARLTVHGPDDFVRTYVGLPD